MTEDIKIIDVVLHYVGNTTAGEGITLSNESLKLSEEVVPYLKYYFLSAFKLEALCNFYHEASLLRNPMFSFAEEIFEKKRSFCEVSTDIARHLYEHSDHPKIKGGDLFVVLFDNVEINHDHVEAIGVFKVENKEDYISIKREGDAIVVDTEKGVNVRKLDKGCLIFNLEKSDGYVVAVVDKTTRGGEAKYWLDDFLHVIPRNDNYNKTKNATALCRAFISSLNGKVEKDERAMMINRLTEFVNEGTFDIEQLSDRVFCNDEIAEGFQTFKDSQEDEGVRGLDKPFVTDTTALKRLSFGNLTNIRLDDNFSISIRGGEKLLEKGYDTEKGMHYYKLFYKEEK